MRQTSDDYKRILGIQHDTEIELVTGNYRSPTTAPLAKKFKMNELLSIRTSYGLFEGNSPTVGCTVSGQIDAEFLIGSKTIDRMEKLTPYIRLVNAEDSSDKSEWIKKGVFYIDTRETTHNNDGLAVMKIHGYDAMLKAQADYPNDNHTYPATDTYIVKKISNAMGLGDISGSGVDERTWDIMTDNYTYGLPIGYSMQEVLSSIAIPYAGNWIITEDGLLRLVSFADIPKETNLLLDHIGEPIIFGYETVSGQQSPVRIFV